MHKGTWKKIEREEAAKFGAKRNRLSGGSGRDDCSRSDSTSETIFLEVKARKGGFATTNLWQDTQKLAKKEGKIPLVVLRELGLHKSWYLMEEKDMLKICTEYMKAKGINFIQEKMDDTCL
jgi:hypothetical protein